MKRKAIYTTSNVLNVGLMKSQPMLQRKVSNDYSCKETALRKTGTLDALYNRFAEKCNQEISPIKEEMIDRNIEWPQRVGNSIF